MNKLILKSLLLSLCILSFNISSQEDNESARVVDEVIVTATKTEKTLQEVPIAVSVVLADDIEKANLNDIFDLKAVIPSLDTRKYTTNTEAAFFIRGFGNGSFNPGIEPSVAVFVDGVYRSSMQSQISDFPVLERIEVLRGPQSTLFGKNATAGVINIVTKKPSFDKSGYAAASIGSNNMKKLKYYSTAVSYTHLTLPTTPYV